MSVQDEFEILEGRKVLVCEDHPINAQIAAAVIEKAGMIADLAENGEVGLQMFSRSVVGEYSAVLMDINMPVSDGIETAKAIRSMQREDAGTVPIIAMTADSRDVDVERALDAGMDMYTAKPIIPQKLYEMLAEAFEKRRVGAE